MKKYLLCLSAVSVALLAGCASTPDSTATYVPDVGKIRAVENAAQRYGTQIVWVNTPMKKVVPSGT